MHIEISNTGTISFIIDPSVINATKKDLEKHDSSSVAHKSAFDKKADTIELDRHRNNLDIHVNATTMENYNTAISGLIDHTENTAVHTNATEKAEWTAGAKTATQAAETAAQNSIRYAELASRISRVEDGLQQCYRKSVPCLL
ncbi:MULTISPECIES: hypothetical protein [Anaerotignum]|uniref:hypothetical protein n=1 Tax=Anaerotignum TaxID=2039240 RepID=UPI00210AFE75|nr:MULTISPECIES: hypothetical protein [Anaerotignum]MCQ4936722.1 hypothetical protein [Anaerotignum propionicum]